MNNIVQEDDMASALEHLSHVSQAVAQVHADGHRPPVAPALQLEILKGRQKGTRTQITAVIKHTRALLAARGSRRAVEASIPRIRALIETAEQLNDQIVPFILEEEPMAAQVDRHLEYTTNVHGMEDAVAAYLASRADEPASVGTLSHQGSSVAGRRVPTPSEILERQRVERRVAEAKQRAEDAHLRARAALEEREAARLDELAAEEDLHALTLNETAASTTTSAAHIFGIRDSIPAVGPAVQAWLNRNPTGRATVIPPPVKVDDDAPDQWIVNYIAGTELAVDDDPSGVQSSASPLPEPFSGRSLEWFAFAEVFYASVHHTRKSTAEKLVLLKRVLRPPASNLVIGAGERAYKKGLENLMKEYGSRTIMREALRQELDAIQMGRDAVSFKRSALSIRAHLFELSRIGESSNTDLVLKLCQKLKQGDLLVWNEGKGLGLDGRTLNQFGDWICSRADGYQDILSIVADQRSLPSGKPPGGARPPMPPRPSAKQQGRTHVAAIKPSGAGASATKPKPNDRAPFCFKCEKAHTLENCEEFKKLSSEDRISFAVQRSLCFVCLRPKHAARDCRCRKACTISGCPYFHHILLHNPAAAGTIITTCGRAEDMAMGCIKLDAISATGEAIPVNLLYDECSTMTLFRDGLIRHLNLSGICRPLELDGVGGQKTTIQRSFFLELTVRTASGEQFILSGSSMPVVAHSVPVTDWPAIKSRWPHLAALPLEKSGGRVDILLGLNHAYLMAVLESKFGGETDPIASRTRIGWIARGLVGKDINLSRIRSCVGLATVGVEDFGPEITSLLRRFCDTEDFGAEHVAPCVSPDNQRAIRMLEAGIIKLPVGYRAPVLWREGEPSLPDNRPSAESRNHSLLNRFRKQPAYETKYREAMQKNFDEGYAVRITPEEVTNGQPCYYLPHFGVPKCRGSDDIRIVFDAAAQFRKRSMNGSICPGPPLQRPLPAVIIGFREGKFGFASDIKAMFSRIRLRPEDMRYHLFLWTEPDGSTTTCMMTRVTFGVNCSPYVAIRTTWKCAEDAGFAFKVAEKAIKRSIYVDDYLDSAETLEDAIIRAKMVKEVLATGDFHLQEFASNSIEFMAALQPEDSPPKTEVSHVIGADDAEAVLGLRWWPKRDTLGFRVAGLDDVTYTRVGLSSKLASLFDPLGIAGPMTVKGKIRIRELGTKGVGWHDKLDGDDLNFWQRWIATLKQLVAVEVPRCLFPDEEHIVRRELHTFGDASEEAYCAVTYIRNVYADGHVTLLHIKATTKLAPTKTISVQKLELCAALLGARLARFVGSALSRQIDGRFFWTDSSTVRHWVRATGAYYKTFVSNRIGEIQTLTEPTEWRFVPGRLNPSDSATRSALECEAIPYTWLYANDYLLKKQKDWPADIPFIAIPDEVRTAKVHHVQITEKTDWGAVNILPDSIPLLVKMDDSYLKLIKACQQEVFQSDLDRLSKKKALKPSSPLLSLTPILDSNGLLRLGGRIGRAELPYDARHPVLLPRNHPFPEKIIMAFHERLHHLGTDYVLTHIRQHFWLTGGREAVKKVQWHCPCCTLDRARPSIQLMADLPECRLDANAPPFSQTACDYFGPIYTSPTTKKWGALFTCLTTRAVYIDMAPSLSAESFLLILRRFISLYGKPKSIYSDNGTNFIGAERELREAVEELHSSAGATSFMKTEAIDWHFQPARTPHFGGSHESLVKSTKKALYAALELEKKGKHFPTEDVLRTLLFEVAGLLNSRPLTYVSSAPNDYRPLTHNDFPNRALAADIRIESDTDVKPRYRLRYQTKMLNLFWDLWHGPYLQSKVARLKWKTTEPNMAVGDYVAEIDQSLRPGQWSTGRIVDVFPGDDGLVRAVDVQLGTGTYRRGIQRLALLERGSSGQTVPAAPASGEHGRATKK